MMQRDFVRVDKEGMIFDPQTLTELRALVLVKYAEADRRTFPYDPVYS